MLLDAERLAHNRERIHRGVLAKRNGHRRECAAIGAIALEVAARHHRGARARRGHAEHRIFAMSATGFAAPFTIATASHDRTAHARKTDRRETRDRIGETRVDQHRSPLDATRGEAAMRPGLVIGAKIQAEHLREGVAVGADRRAEADDETVEVARASVPHRRAHWRSQPMRDRWDCASGGGRRATRRRRRSRSDLSDRSSP